MIQENHWTQLYTIHIQRVSSHLDGNLVDLLLLAVKFDLGEEEIVAGGGPLLHAKLGLDGGGCAGVDLELERRAVFGFIVVQGFQLTHFACSKQA